jgi:hypothetical protein
MQEARIRLRCPDCEEQWEANPSDLPVSSDRLTCDGCGESRRVSEFAKTARSLEVLEAVHEE